MILMTMTTITGCIIHVVCLCIFAIILRQPTTHADAVSTHTSSLYKHQRETVTRAPFVTRGAFSENTLRLGGTISYDANDDFRFYGQQTLDAWMFFIEWVNEVRGGILINGTNYSVSLAYMDDFTDMEFVKNGFEFMLGNNSILEGLDFMLSPYSSSLTDAAQQVAISQVLVLIFLPFCCACAAFPTITTLRQIVISC